MKSSYFSVFSVNVFTKTHNVGVWGTLSPPRKQIKMMLTISNKVSMFILWIYLMDLSYGFIVCVSPSGHGISSSPQSASISPSRPSIVSVSF